MSKVAHDFSCSVLVGVQYWLLVMVYHTSVPMLYIPCECISLLDNNIVLCLNFWTLRFSWKIGLDNSKLLLKKLYFLTVKDKLSTGHVVKILWAKADIKEHASKIIIQRAMSRAQDFLVFLKDIRLFSLIFPSGLQPALWA